MKKPNVKRHLPKWICCTAICCLVFLLNGCGAANTSATGENRDGYIELIFPDSVLNEQKAQERIEADQSFEVEFKKANGEEAWQEFLTGVPYTTIEMTEEGEICFLCTPEQYERYKDGVLRLATSANGLEKTFGIQGYEAAEIDEDGIPWKIVVTFHSWNKKYLESATKVAGEYRAKELGQYQIICGVPKDQWKVQVTFLDEATGEILLEKEYPRDNTE